MEFSWQKTGGTTTVPRSTTTTKTGTDFSWQKPAPVVQSLEIDDKMGRGEVLGRAAAFQAVPTTGAIASGVAGAKGGALLGSAFGPVGTAVGGVLGAVGGGILGAVITSKAQEKALEIVKGDEWLAKQQQKLAQGRKDQPLTSFAGEVAPQLLTLKPSPKTVVSALKFAQNVLTNPKTASTLLTTPAGKAALDDLINVSIGGTAELGTEAYNQAKEGDFNAVRLIAAGTVGSLINQPNKFGMKIGMKPSGEMEVTPEVGVEPIKPQEFSWTNKPEAPVAETASPDLDPLLQEARKYKSAEEFVRANDLGTAGVKFHITDNPNFQIDKNIIPSDVPAGAGTGKVLSKSEFEKQLLDEVKIFRERGIKTEPEIKRFLEVQRKMYEEAGGGGGLMATRGLEPWLEKGVLSGDRKYVAIIDTSNVPLKDMTLSTRGFGDEIFIQNPQNAKVVRVVPIEEALKIQNQSRLTKSQLTDIWERANKGESATIRPSGLAENLKATAIEKGLEGDFGESPLYEVRKMAPVIKQAADFVVKDPETAMKVARGEASPPDGLLHSEVTAALARKAFLEQDAAMIKRLATDEKVTTLATEAGRTVKGYDTGLSIDPVASVKEVVLAREEGATKRQSHLFKKTPAKDVKKRLLDKGVEEVKKAVKQKKQTWAEFIKDLQC